MANAFGEKDAKEKIMGDQISKHEVKHSTSKDKFYASLDEKPNIVLNRRTTAAKPPCALCTVSTQSNVAWFQAVIYSKLLSPTILLWC